MPEKTITISAQKNDEKKEDIKQEDIKQKDQKVEDTPLSTENKAE